MTSWKPFREPICCQLTVKQHHNREESNVPNETMSSTGSTEEPIINEYEALRQAKIARNEARLRSLGLLRMTPAPKQTVGAATKAPTRAVTPNAVPLRRSKRARKAIHSSIEEQDSKHQRVREQEYADPENQKVERDDEDYRPTAEEDPEHLDEGKVTKKSQNATRPSRKTSRPLIIPPKSPPSSTPHLPPNSARAMKLNVTQLLTNNVIGKTLTKTGWKVDTVSHTDDSDGKSCYTA